MNSDMLYLLFYDCKKRDDIGYSKSESSTPHKQVEVVSANDCCYISTQFGKRN